MSPRRPAALRAAAADRTLREHLLATATGLIAERGGGLTVRDIARAAGVADGVLYNHFADKEELLAHALHEHVRSVMEVTRSLPEAGSATVADNLAVYIRTALDVLARVTPAFVGFLRQPEVVNRFHGEFAPFEAPESLPQRLAAYVRGEQDLGRVRLDADPVAVAALVIGACHDRILPLLFQPPGAKPVLPAGFVDSLVTTVLRGIEPPDARV